MRRLVPILLVGAAVFSIALSLVQAQDAPPAVLTLKGYAVLPADTFTDGPASGAKIDPSQNLNGRTIPFKSQPVQGISAILPVGNGNYYVMSDNGYGAKGNSADFMLRFDEVKVDFSTGKVEVVGFTGLSDPDKKIPFPIVNNDTPDRLLTGADFDIESFRQLADGTFWFGEELGPFLLHTDKTGKVLEAPIPTPYPDVLAKFTRSLKFIESPDNPEFVSLADADARKAAANLPSSKGFEGMALNSAGDKLYPLMEGPLVDDTDRNHLLIQEFDLKSTAYTGKFWFYPMSAPGNSIGDMTAINENEYLVIERDNGQGLDAAFKRIYKIDLSKVGDDGHTVSKTLVADLMGIYDAKGLTKPEKGAVGLGPVFKFPFVTIESVYPVDADTLIVVNDNNYPFSSGRRPGIAADDNEFILLSLPEALNLTSK